MVDRLEAEISRAVPGVRVSAVTEVIGAKKDLVNRFANFSVAVSLLVLLIGA